MSTARLPKIAEYLLKAKVVDEFQLRSALAEQGKWGHRLTRALGDLRLAPEAKVVAALAAAMRLPAVDLAALPLDSMALKKLDADYCEEKGVFPCALADHGKLLTLAMCDPTDFATTDEIEKKTRCRLKLLVTGETALAQAIVRGYKASRPAAISRGMTPISASAGIELQAATTGEFMDAKGEVVGAIRDERRQRSAPPVAGSDAQAAVNDQLDALFGVSQDLSAEEQARLDEIQKNHGRGTAVLRAVLELCVEKGLLSADDVNALKL